MLTGLVLGISWLALRLSPHLESQVCVHGAQGGAQQRDLTCGRDACLLARLRC